MVVQTVWIIEANPKTKSSTKISTWRPAEPRKRAAKFTAKKTKESFKHEHRYYMIKSGRRGE